MPREARKVSESGIYHVVVRGIDRQLMFEEEQDFKTYLQFLRVYKAECELEIYAYCLMSNHVHLVVKTGKMKIGRVFSKINTNYAVWFNQKYQRTGHLQQDRYYSDAIDTEQYFLEAIRYVHRNPQKAGIEKRVGDSYQWSSYHDYAAGTSKLVDVDVLFSLIPKDDFDSYTSTPSDVEFKDVDNIRKRFTDTEALNIIKDVTGCNNMTEFQSLPIDERNHYLHILKQKKLSVKQLSRLTGISVGVINRAIAKENGIQFREKMNSVGTYVD